MRNVITIADKEIRHFLASPIAYTAFVLFLLISGVAYNANVIHQHKSGMEDIFWWKIYLFLLIIPALTMHLFAEERRSGTIELLMTYPIHDWQVVIGKFFAGMALLIGMLLLTFHYPLILLMWGNPDKGTILTGYLGLILLGTAFVSIGILTTSLTKSQNVAFIMGAGILFAFLILGMIGNSFIGQGWFVNFISYLSLTEHYRNFSLGIINTRDLVFFLSVIFFSLFVSVRIIEIKRWQD